MREGANAVSGDDETKKRFGIMARELFKRFKFVSRKETSSDAWARRDAIDAIYKEITKRRDVADTGDIMVQLQQVIDEHISVQENSDKEPARFDISKIDFDLLQTEFKKAEQKNLLLDDLRIVIERRL